MTKALRHLRSRRFRLLASLLVMLAMLCNGICLAQAHAHAMAATQDCCAEMNGHEESMSHCGDAAKSPHQGCDEQCMVRCMTANALLSVPLTIASSDLIMSSLSQLKTSEHSLADLGPGLRPPIYS